MLSCLSPTRLFLPINHDLRASSFKQQDPTVEISVFFWPLQQARFSNHYITTSPFSLASHPISSSSLPLWVFLWSLSVTNTTQQCPLKKRERPKFTWPSFPNKLKDMKVMFLILLFFNGFGFFLCFLCWHCSRSVFLLWFGFEMCVKM